ncbi:MAG: HNH endonuclease [Spirochaetes bacterium]|nr:MAG: HNH endonuclease [Spirochaetota bacterium]
MDSARVTQKKSLDKYCRNLEWATDLHLDLKGYLRLSSGRLLHRAVYRLAHGPIPRGWVVHHIDHSKLNNKPGNLIAIPQQFHDFIHRRQWCGGKLIKKRHVLQRELTKFLKTYSVPVLVDGIPKQGGHAISAEISRKAKAKAQGHWLNPNPVHT